MTFPLLEEWDGEARRPGLDFAPAAPLSGSWGKSLDI